MSLECPNNPTYHTSAKQKLQSKNAAKTYRYGTPKLRDLLREKCRIRVREARARSFQMSRKLDEVDIQQILREELAEFEQDIERQEEIYKELVDELNEWFAEQLEEQVAQEESYLINVAESDDILCPVCQKQPLQCQQISDKHLYHCSCQTNFSCVGDELQLRSQLRTKIDEHERTCDASLTFFVEPQQQAPIGNVLNAICEKCDYFCSF